MWGRPALLAVAMFVGLALGAAGQVLDPLVGVHCHNPPLSTVTGVVFLASAAILQVSDNLWVCRLSAGLAVIGGAHLLHSFTGNSASIIVGLAITASTSGLGLCRSSKRFSS